MSLNLLLVEDSPYKCDCIMDYLSSREMDVSTTVVSSFNSARRALLDHTYQVILLDMSLPTYDKTESSAGGNTRQLGGRELARRVVRKWPNTMIIFITQYQSFSDTTRSYTFAHLQVELKKECGGQMRGMIYFDNSKSSWKDELGKLLEELTNEYSNS
jgi:CheY-like chemotaxis protein